MNLSPWWILFLPFIAFAAIPLIPERKRFLAGWLACAAIFAAFLLTLKLALPLFQGLPFSPSERSIEWISISGLQFEFGFLIDSLSLLMLLVVTGVGSLIFYYSLEYMGEDEGFRRYFAGLSLFAFSMIGIVISNNLLQLFIFWELVGLSSYLLIGHWYQKPEAADAGKKAFLTNRVGDFGFLIGILLLWMFSASAGPRTVHLLQLNSGLAQFLQAAPGRELWVTLAMLLIFAGVVGKSAQFPLHVWLPDAMEGPAPVSALIHAATMVAAGVYLLARAFPLFALAPSALETIAYVGGFTAIFSATQALVQTDLKRILAYSTLSQLGYMVMAVGLGSAPAAMYHLTTHAFFKALLFLSAGSVIHAAGIQNIFELGGLAKKMPLTSAAFLIGTFSLVGFWPASGFFSKDEILILAFHRNPALFLVGTATVFLTALYMGRAVSAAFLGRSKIRKKLEEPTQKMWIPLILLSLASLSAGWFHLDRLFQSPHEVEAAHEGGQALVVFLSTALGLFGLVTAFAFYGAPEPSRNRFQKKFAWAREILVRKYYMDELYEWILNHVQKPFSEFLAAFERRFIVAGAVNGTSELAAQIGYYLRKLQTGRVQTYLSVFLAGVTLFIYALIVKEWR